MARLRFMAVALLALALAGNSAQTGRSQGQASSAGTYTQSTAIPADDRSCVIYSLTDRGYDADLGTWIAQILPDMVEPSSWKGSGGTGVLHYYAPKNILIVNNSAAVRSKVDDFLKKLKTSLPKTSRTKFAANKNPSRANVVPAEYRAPAPTRTANPLPEASSYPVPAPVKAPKHLFHFLIRYEGEGIIDDNVVKFMKGYIQASKDGNSQTPAGQSTAQGSPDPTPPSSGGTMYGRSDSSAPSAPPAGTVVPAAMPDGSSGAGAPVEALPMPREKKKDGRKKKSDKESPCS
jgi:hypothetical protein